MNDQQSEIKYTVQDRDLEFAGEAIVALFTGGKGINMHGPTQLDVQQGLAAYAQACATLAARAMWLLAVERSHREDRDIPIVGIVDECRDYPPDIELHSMRLVMPSTITAARKVVYDDRGRVSHLIDVK